MQCVIHKLTYHLTVTSEFILTVKFASSMNQCLSLSNFLSLSFEMLLFKKFNKVRASGKIYVMSFNLKYTYKCMLTQLNLKQVVKYQSLITSHVILP